MRIQNVTRDNHATLAYAAQELTVGSVNGGKTPGSVEFNVQSTAEIVAELKAGRMVILIDEEDHENGGDLDIAAEHITPKAISFMAEFGRGLLALPSVA